MSIIDFYNYLGSNFENVKNRISNEEMLKKYIVKFKSDKSFSLLEKSIAEDNLENSFIYAHTLKGLYLTLGFDKFFPPVNQLTELLRQQENKTFDLESIKNVFKICKNDYQNLIDCINKIE